jgi:hypothetical protein
MGIVFIIIYVTFSLLVAWAGRRATMGFFGVLALSLIVTPLVTAILLVLFWPRGKKKKS